MIGTGGFATLLAPGMWRILFNAINQQPNQWVAVFNVKDSDRAYEEESYVAGLGSMVSKPEGTATQFDDPLMGGTLRYTHSSYGLGFRITREMWDDDLYSIMNRMPAELGRACSYKVEIDAWSVLNGAFSTTLGIDGLSLCNTAHTRLDGGEVIANKPSTDVDFGFTAFQAGLDHYATLVDDRGRPQVLSPQLLIIDPSFRWAAKEVLGTEYKPYSDENTINPLKGEISENGFLACRYLTDANAWFLLSGKGGDEGNGHDLRFFWRVRPETAESDDFLTGDALFKIYARYSKGVAYWRGVYGSSGGA
jgi:hypothetical protein